VDRALRFTLADSDRFIGGKLFGNILLGYYAVANDLASLPINKVTGLINSIALPAFAKTQLNPAGAVASLLTVTRLMSLLAFPFFLGMSSIASELTTLLLGPKWREAGSIFMLLGIAAIIQPVTKTTWWLFSTQGRTRDLFHWGIMSGSIASLSIVTGLRWGAVGVAASYAISDLLITTPLLFWYVGRQGPVRASDFYRTIAPFVCASLSALAVVLVCRRWLEVSQHLMARLAIALAITSAVSFIVLMALPAGRLAIQNLKEMMMLFIGRNQESAV